MPAPTPEAFRAALAAPGARVKDACASLGITLAGITARAPRGGPHLHPELVAVLAEARAARAARRLSRGERRKLGEHQIALPPETLAKLDALAVARGSTRAAVARELLDAAPDPLPAPLPANRARKVVLDLGPAWTRLVERAGTTDPQAIAGLARAILARGEIDERREDVT